MAKTQADPASDFTPISVFAVNGEAFYEDLQAVIQYLNYSFKNCQGFGLAVGIDGWGGTGSVATHNQQITESSYETIYHFDVWIDEDFEDFEISAELHCDGASGATVRTTVGATVETQAFTSAENDTIETLTHDVSALTGVQQVVIEVKYDAGSAGDCELVDLSFEFKQRTSGLPDPVLE